MKVIHIIYLARDDYQKIRIMQNNKICYEKENANVPEKYKNAKVKHWFVDNGVLVLSIL